MKKQRLQLFFPPTYSYFYNNDDLREEQHTGKRLIYMKKVLSIKEVEPGIIRVRIEANKRRKIWLKRIASDGIPSCDPQICSFYYLCTNYQPPLKKYSNFSEFCNHLFREYPKLREILKEKFRVTSINQVVPMKIKR